MSSRIITCEEYYLHPSYRPTPSFIPPVTEASPAIVTLPYPLLEDLEDLGHGRISNMKYRARMMQLPLRSPAMEIQILSHVSLRDTPDKCRKINEWLPGKTRLESERYRGLALLPFDPKEAASELSRCCRLNTFFVGGVLPVRRDDIFGPEWDELWKTATFCGVPIALRPAFLSYDELAAFKGPGPLGCCNELIHLVSPLHTVSPWPIFHLYTSSVFDRHPNLRLILSQQGWGIPALIPRIRGAGYSLFPDLEPRPKKSFIEVWKKNFYVTTGDMLESEGSWKTLLETLPVERVLLGTGYPIMQKTIALERQAELMGKLMTDEQIERVFRKNAEVVFLMRSER